MIGDTLCQGKDITVSSATASLVLSGNQVYEVIIKNIKLEGEFLEFHKLYMPYRGGHTVVQL